ncbi:MAG: nucleoside-diphosphate sugar epimerase/dehydratase, partial [Hyphomonadaceae bacterium]
MSLAAFEQFGVKLEQEQAEPVGWPPVSAETVWLFAQATQVAPANEHARPFPTPPRRRRRFEAKHIWRCVAVLDWLVVVAVAQIAALWGHGQTLAALPLGKAAAIVAGAVALKAGLWLTGAYTAAPARTGPETALGGLALGVIAGLFMAAFAAPDARLAAAFAATLPLAAIALAALHAAAALAVRHAWRRGLFAETAVLVGATPAAERLIERAKALRDLDIVAVIEDRGARAPATLAGAPVAGGVDDLLAWPHLPEIDRIVVCVDHGAHTRVRALLARLQ